LPTLSSNVLQNHFRLVSGCCFHSTLQSVSPEAFELATSCSVNKASTSSSPFFCLQDHAMVGGRLVNVDEPALMERHGEIKRPAYIF
jgi:hypothetical protein